jgi:hypothetical protein
MRVFSLVVAVLLGACAVEAGSEVSGDGDSAKLPEETPVPTKSLNMYISKVSGEKQGAFRGGAVQQPASSTTATTPPK